MDDQKNHLTENLKNERNTNLPSALSALSNETETVKLIENIKTCMRYISTFNISEVDEKLLQCILPVLRDTLQKAFDDNFLLSDTCDDDFVLNILKQNLTIILQLICVLKEILEFIVENSEISLCDVKHVAVISIHVITATFDHCRKSSDTYKKNFNEDLLEIFRIMQDVHSTYIQIFESCIVVGDILEDETNIHVLLQVMDSLCTLSETLFCLNVKLLTTNWKGYLGVAQKFFEVLKDTVDLKRPTMYLTSIIENQFTSIKESDSVELATTQIIKLSGFLVKVVLKIFDIFWDYKQKYVHEIMEFCCMIYSFSSYKFIMMQCPLELTKLLDETVFAHMKPFVLKFLQDGLFPQVVTNKAFLSEKYCFGFLNFLNICLEGALLIEHNQQIELDGLIRMIFQCTKLCFEELFWPEDILDDLIINITAVIITHNNFYGKVEIILLENILQEDIWNYFLAVEIWCLLLRNSAPRFCADTLNNLIKIYDELNFGINSHRLERIYLISLMRRVFRILPDYMKTQMGQSIYTQNRVWKYIGFSSFPKQMKNILEDVHLKTLEKFEQMKKDGDFGVKDLVVLVENLDSLSTIDYREMNISATNIMNAIENIWELQCTETVANNIFKYFIAIVCKITGHFIKEFNNRQLYTILNQAAHLSSMDYFKLHLSFMLKPICYINTNQLGQDGCKIFKTTSNILAKLLLDSNNLIKQDVLELLESLTQNGKYDVVRDVLANCSRDSLTQEIISNYLRKRSIRSPFNRGYYKALGGLNYKHSCVRWRSDCNFKRIRLDTVEKELNSNYQNNDILRDTNLKYRPIENEQIINYHQQDISREDKTVSNVKYKLKEFKYKHHYNKKERVEEKHEAKENDVDNIDEIISRMKGEVKCLMNVLKTEKLSRKNVSDLKILSNQLSTLM